VRGGRNFIVLRDGEEIIAEFMLRSNGDLRFLPEGKFEKGKGK
jgi:hypothetical protein